MPLISSDVDRSIIVITYENLRTVAVIGAGVVVFVIVTIRSVALGWKTRVWLRNAVVAYSASSYEKRRQVEARH